MSRWSDAVFGQLVLFRAVEINDAEAQAEQIVFAVEAELKRGNRGGTNNADDVGHLLVADLEPIIRRLEVFQLPVDKAADALSQHVPMFGAVEIAFEIPRTNVVEWNADVFVFAHVCMELGLEIVDAVEVSINLGLAFAGANFGAVILQSFFSDDDLAMDFACPRQADAYFV